MARITGAQNERVFQIKKWLGLNENPDGDTKLKMGEAAAMRNFRVTRDGNLQKRPGTREILTISRGKPVDAVWTGLIGGVERVMAICDGQLWSCWDGSEWSAESAGTLGATDRPGMFGFSDKLYILTGSKYFEYDGSTLTEPTGYIPLIATTIPPNGGGETLEQVNKLTAKRRVWLSPDGENNMFQLPEKDLASIDYVIHTADGSPVTLSAVSPEAGTVIIGSTPAGTNTIEVGYTAKSDFRSQVCAMHFAETYNGSQDTRVFLYGDGSNQAFYSGIDYDGNPRADYFPDLNVMNVGVSNTPITAMIRHYSRLICFKSDSTYSIQYGQITLEGGALTAAFYVTPVNRSIGNEAPGQAQLVLNNPVTLFGSDAYQWVGNNYGNLSSDERQAKRISDRVYDSLHGMTIRDCVCFDDNYRQEYYISHDGTTLVWNYAADCWYLYTNFRLHRPFAFHNELYFGSEAGGIQAVKTVYAYDSTGAGAPEPVDCHWESGSMSFGADYQRKYSAMLWLGMKPESKAAIVVTVQTDRSSSYTEKALATSLASFGRANFRAWSFVTNRRPQMTRLKIKAKKFVYYKLILESDNEDATATVTSADIRVRFTGYTK